MMIDPLLKSYASGLSILYLEDDSVPLSSEKCLNHCLAGGTALLDDTEGLRQSCSLQVNRFARYVSLVTDGQ